ncbi:hypothetical protein ACFYUD_32390 [Nocardia tengchongensis]|uniref:hypothetical protein n=1 Tax=Nocardia tengchongensis TaxID=2055889 RepID=UPI00368C31B0
MLSVTVGGDVVDADSLGDDRRWCLQDELPQSGNPAGDGGDAGLGGVLAKGFGPERLAGAAARE